MQPLPPMVAAETSMRQTINLIVSLAFVVGLGCLAVAGMIWSYSYVGVPSGGPLPQGSLDLQRAWAPIFWNLGMLFLLLGILGNAVYRKTTDPLARLLLWLVALVVALLLVTTPTIFFTFG